MTTAQLLKELRRRGVLLEVVGDRLRVTAPHGAVRDLLPDLTEHKAMLLDLVGLAAPLAVFSTFVANSACSPPSSVVCEMENSNPATDPGGSELNAPAAEGVALAASPPVIAEEEVECRDDRAERLLASGERLNYPRVVLGKGVALAAGSASWFALVQSESSHLIDKALDAIIDID